MKHYFLHFTKRFLLVLFVLALSQGKAEAVQEIVAVQSIRVKPFEESLKGFQSVLPARVTRIVLSEQGETDLDRKIARIRPDLILAIGQEALMRVKGIESTPIVYLMVPNPQSVLSGEKNICGVSMNIPEETQISALLNVLPDTQTIGLLYDPERSGDVVKRAMDFATLKGKQLIAKPVRDPKNVPKLAMSMRKRIDVFWMLPDLTVVTPETVEFFLLFSLENKIPILTFSDKYVEMGAFMSMDIDAHDMGTQAGEMAKRILTGNDTNKAPTLYARKAVVTTNMMVAGKLGIYKNLATNLLPYDDRKIARKPWPLDRN